MAANEREARLVALEKATKEWALNSRQNLQKRVDLAKAILRGRTGSDRLSRSASSAVADLVVEKLDEFLTG